MGSAHRPGVAVLCADFPAPLVVHFSGISHFIKGYRAFAETAYNKGFTKYEDFVSDPAAAIRKLCNDLKLPFDETFIEKWKFYINVTGDTRQMKARSNAIGIYRTPEIDTHRRKIFRGSKDCKQAIQLLGYQLDA